MPTWNHTNRLVSSHKISTYTCHVLLEAPLASATSGAQELAWIAHRRRHGRPIERGGRQGAGRIVGIAGAYARTRAGVDLVLDRAQHPSQLRRQLHQPQLMQPRGVVLQARPESLYQSLLGCSCHSIWDEETRAGLHMLEELMTAFKGMASLARCLTGRTQDLNTCKNRLADCCCVMLGVRQ